MNNQSDSQRGGILAFLLVGVLLTVLLAGGIYASKNQGRNAATQPVSTNTQPDTSKKDAGTTTKDQSKTPAEDMAKKPDQATPKPATPTTPAPSTPKPTTSPQPSGIANTGPSEIASTGPTDTLLSIVALALTAGGASAYRRSVQRMRLAALK